MNIPATIIIFDEIYERKNVIRQRIQSIETFSKTLYGEDRRFVRNELAALKDEYDWITQLQVKVLRALYNGDK